MNNHQCKQHINCSNGHHVNDIHASSEWNILNDVVELLKNGNAVDTPMSEPIVDFKFPEELKVGVSFVCLFFSTNPNGRPSLLATNSFHLETGGFENS